MRTKEKKKWTLVIVLVSLFMGIYFYNNSYNIVFSKEKRTNTDLYFLKSGLKIYWLKYYKYPDSLSRLKELSKEITELKSLSYTDPWGQPYVYEKKGETIPYILYSKGPNQKDDYGKEDDISLLPE